MKQLKSIAILSIVIMMGFFIGCALNESAPVSAGENQNSGVNKDVNGPRIIFSIANIPATDKVCLYGTLIDFPQPSGYFSTEFNCIEKLDTTTNVYTFTSYCLPRAIMGFSSSLAISKPLLPGIYRVCAFVYPGSPYYCSNPVTYQPDITYAAIPWQSSTCIWVSDGAPTATGGMMAEFRAKLSSNPAFNGVGIKYSVKKNGNYGSYFYNGNLAGHDYGPPMEGIKIQLECADYYNFKIQYCVLDSTGRWSDWTPRNKGGAEAKPNDGGAVYAIKVLFFC